MGHAYSSIIADFFARLKKIQGFNVYFLTGTDEHGQKIQRAAEEKKMDPLLFCDEISKTFRDLSQTLNLSNNDFIRTTEARHAKSVQNLWNILEKKGEIYLSKYSGCYSVSDEDFYSESEIEDVDGAKKYKWIHINFAWRAEMRLFNDHTSVSQKYPVPKEYVQYLAQWFTPCTKHLLHVIETIEANDASLILGDFVPSRWKMAMMGMT